VKVGRRLQFLEERRKRGAITGGSTLVRKGNQGQNRGGISSIQGTEGGTASWKQKVYISSLSYTSMRRNQQGGVEAV